MKKFGLEIKKKDEKPKINLNKFNYNQDNDSEEDTNDIKNNKYDFQTKQINKSIKHQQQLNTLKVIYFLIIDS